MEPERLAFSLATLADAASAARPLTGCPLGHLVVAGRTHWQAETLDTAVKTLTFAYVEGCTSGEGGN